MTGPGMVIHIDVHMLFVDHGGQCHKSVLKRWNSNVKTACLFNFGNVGSLILFETKVLVER